MVLQNTITGLPSPSRSPAATPSAPIVATRLQRSREKPSGPFQKIAERVLKVSSSWYLLAISSGRPSPSRSATCAQWANSSGRNCLTSVRSSALRISIPRSVATISSSRPSPSTSAAVA